MQTPSMNEILPPELVETLGYDQITSGHGYTEATFFKLTGFIILTVAAVAIVGYTADALAGMHEPLEWPRAISPFYWAFGNQPLANGIDAAGLAAAAVVLTAATAWALSWRDITG